MNGVDLKDSFPKLENRDLPSPPHWSKALGVGIVVMGLAMGTGELILWPHLVIKHGFGLLWLALAGITAQFVVNYEVARHSIATGESFFTSLGRIIPWSFFFWLPAAILLYIWPGWASAIGTTLKELFGFGTHLIWAWATLGLMLVFTFSGKVAYRVLEGTLKITVPAFFLILLFISFFNLDWDILRGAISGVFNFGDIPAGVDINVLLGAVVFSGAGGMLNLCVGLWYRDKKAGMGEYIGQIKNPITGKPETVAVSGFSFMTTRENLVRWKGWMRYILIDQGVIFWFLGFITLLLLSVNAYAVLSPKGLVPEGLDVAVVQAHIFGDIWGPIGFKVFLVMAFLMLFSVMWTVIDALTRMVSDMIYTNSRVGPYKNLFRSFRKIPLSVLYYAVIVIVAVVGAALIPFNQPLTLLVISGVLSGLSMAIYVPLLFFLNNTRLPKEIRPSFYGNVFLIAISAFYIFFAYKVVENLFS